LAVGLLLDILVSGLARRRFAMLHQISPKTLSSAVIHRSVLDLP
jgi:hypothetical protein